MLDPVNLKRMVSRPLHRKMGTREPYLPQKAIQILPKKMASMAKF